MFISWTKSRDQNMKNHVPKEISNEIFVKVE